MRKMFQTALLIFAAVHSGAPAFAMEKRMKVIDFEDEVVEGVNKRPLDSLSYISDADKAAKKPHLYKKRAGFREETRTTLNEMRYE